MNNSFFPGCDHMYENSSRRLANFCQTSPGILLSSDPLPWTDSSCESGRTKFSLNAYSPRKVSWLWWNLRNTGSFDMYDSVSCIQPMSHFNPNPSPPRYVGRDTIGHAVDSSAMVWIAGNAWYASRFIRCRKLMASRFSRPPNLFGIHSPSFRE